MTKQTSNILVHGQWFNYRTAEYETRGPPTTDEEALLLIPQDPAVTGIYQCYRMEGLSILDSMKNTLSLCIGDPAPIQVPGSEG